jgi:hypothetical protein
MELSVAQLAPRILRCFLDFWRICAPLLYSIVTCILTPKELVYEVNKMNVQWRGLLLVRVFLLTHNLRVTIKFGAGIWKEGEICTQYINCNA